MDIDESGKTTDVESGMTDKNQASRVKAYMRLISMDAPQEMFDAMNDAFPIKLAKASKPSVSIKTVASSVAKLVRDGATFDGNTITLPDSLIEGVAGDMVKGVVESGKTKGQPVDKWVADENGPMDFEALVQWHLE